MITGLSGREFARSRSRPGEIRFVPAEILVEADHIEMLGQPVLDGEKRAVDEAGRRREPRGINGFRGFRKVLP